MHADERLLETSVEMAGKLPPGLPHTQLGGRGALSWRPNTIADADVMKAG